MQLYHLLHRECEGSGIGTKTLISLNIVTEYSLTAEETDIDL